MVMLPIPFIPLNLKPEKTILLRPNSEREKKKKKTFSINSENKFKLINYIRLKENFLSISLKKYSRK